MDGSHQTREGDPIMFYIALEFAIIKMNINIANLYE